jgi:truncated hemoglobin YjbI
VYEAAGGQQGLLRLAEAWHARVLADEIVSHAFSHGFDPEHTRRLAAYWAEALGGPQAYSGVFGDESFVVRIHSGNGRHEEMDRRAIACFDRALDDAGLAADETLRRVLHDYFAWATTTSMAQYHESADDVPAGLDLPHWSWNGLEDKREKERVMSYVVDFTNVSTIGLESSPVAPALAGLRANEARYFKNKYDHDFTVEPAGEAKETIEWVHRILWEERDLVISSRPLEATVFQVQNIKWAYVFYESGLSINVLYTLEDARKRAVGFKLSDGMEVPAELASRFKFARQKSKLAGTIRGSFFVIKGEY